MLDKKNGWGDLVLHQAAAGSSELCSAQGVLVSDVHLGWEGSRV